MKFWLIPRLIFIIMEVIQIHSIGDCITNGNETFACGNLTAYYEALNSSNLWAGRSGQTNEIFLFDRVFYPQAIYFEYPSRIFCGPSNCTITNIRQNIIYNRLSSIKLIIDRRTKFNSKLVVNVPVFYKFYYIQNDLKTRYMVFIGCISSNIIEKFLAKSMDESQNITIFLHVLENHESEVNIKLLREIKKEEWCHMLKCRNNAIDTQQFMGILYGSAPAVVLPKCFFYIILCVQVILLY